MQNCCVTLISLETSIFKDNSYSNCPSMLYLLTDVIIDYRKMGDIWYWYTTENVKVTFISIM